MKDLNILEEMAMELMSTEGEEITGLLLQVSYRLFPTRSSDCTTRAKPH